MQDILKRPRSTGANGFYFGPAGGELEGIAQWYLGKSAEVTRRVLDEQRARKHPWRTIISKVVKCQRGGKDASGAQVSTIDHLLDLGAFLRKQRLYTHTALVL